MATADPGELATVFAGAALDRFATRTAHSRLLQERLETQTLDEAVVHWSAAPGSGQVVLQVRGRQRLVIGGRPTAWDSTVAQWSFAVVWRNSWRVCEAIDLAAADWWRQ